MTLGNLPSWLYPKVQDVLPFLPVAKVWGVLGSSTQKAKLSDADRKAIGLRLRAGFVARFTPEQRAGWAKNAAAARLAKMTPEKWSEFGRQGGIASQAARSPREKVKFGRRAAAVTNRIRWGFNG
jgi:hypothetical protein